MFYLTLNCYICTNHFPNVENLVMKKIRFVALAGAAAKIRDTELSKKGRLCNTEFNNENMLLFFFLLGGHRFINT